MCRWTKRRHWTLVRDCCFQLSFVSWWICESVRMSFHVCALCKWKKYTRNFYRSDKTFLIRQNHIDWSYKYACVCKSDWTGLLAFIVLICMYSAVECVRAIDRHFNARKIGSNIWWISEYSARSNAVTNVCQNQNQNQKTRKKKKLQIILFMQNRNISPF